MISSASESNIDFSNKGGGINDYGNGLWSSPNVDPTPILKVEDYALKVSD